MRPRSELRTSLRVCPWHTCPSIMLNKNKSILHHVISLVRISVSQPVAFPQSHQRRAFNSKPPQHLLSNLHHLTTISTAVFVSPSSAPYTHPLTNETQTLRLLRCCCSTPTLFLLLCICFTCSPHTLRGAERKTRRKLIKSTSPQQLDPAKPNPPQRLQPPHRLLKCLLTSFANPHLQMLQQTAQRLK